MPEDDSIKRMPIKDLGQEDGAHELATSPEMEPYLRLIMAQMQGNDTKAETEVRRQLPLEKRYVWRVASALKWAFADFDDLSVTADKDTAHTRGFRQGEGSFETAAHAVLPFSEGARRRRRDAADDGPGDWGGNAGALIVFCIENIKSTFCSGGRTIEWSRFLIVEAISRSIEEASLMRRFGSRRLRSKAP